MARTPGLRLKFNLALVPIVAVGIAIMIWADYRHEYGTLMEAHAAHTSTIGTGAAGGPMDPWTLPDVAARRSPRNARLVLDLPAGTASVGPRRGQVPSSAECVGRVRFPGGVSSGVLRPRWTGTMFIAIHVSLSRDTRGREESYFE